VIERARLVAVGVLGVAACATGAIPPSQTSQDHGPESARSEAPPVESAPVDAEPVADLAGTPILVAPMEIVLDELRGLAPPERPGPREVVLGPEVRQQMFASELSYNTLPLANSPVTASGETVKFTETHSNVAIVMSPGLVSEIEIGSIRFFLSMAGNPFGGGAPATGEGARFSCVQGIVGTAVRWRGFRPATVSPESLGYAEFFGTLDRTGCVAVAYTRLEVRATALVPRTLYAFRRCISHCEVGLESERREILTVVAPPSSFVLASDAPPNEMTQPHVGSFTIVEIPVEQSRAASASIRLPVSSEKALRAIAPDPPAFSVLGASGLLVDVEVMGPSGDQQASLSLHVSTLVEPPPKSAAPGTLNPRSVRGFGTP
jgi:hypothetical protein